MDDDDETMETNAIESENNGIYKIFINNQLVKQEGSFDWIFFFGSSLDPKREKKPIFVV